MGDSVFSNLEGIAGLIAHWDFHEPAGSRRLARGKYGYALREMAGPVERVGGGQFSEHAAYLRYGQWFSIPRQECPGLDIHGPTAQVTVAAWLKRHRKPEIQCEFIAGMWDESRMRRQYGLFLDLRIHDGADQVGGHISGTGGPSEGSRWCLDASIGYTQVSYFERWHCVAFTYDGSCARSYLNGILDVRQGTNPLQYGGGLYDGGHDGADFTVGAVDRLGETGNWFTGCIGGLAVYDRALTDCEMRQLSINLPKYDVDPVAEADPKK